MNTQKIVLLENIYPAQREMIKRVLRTAREEGDIETVNHNQLGRLKTYGINFKKL